jgi:hypothetical protein
MCFNLVNVIEFDVLSLIKYYFYSESTLMSICIIFITLIEQVIEI